MSNYFSEKETEELLQKIKTISNVGFIIKDKDTKTDLSKLDKLTDRQAVFAKATLWKIVQDIVETLYFDKLKDGELKFNKLGYSVIVKLKKEDSGVV